LIAVYALLVPIVCDVMQCNAMYDILILILVVVVVVVVVGNLVMYFILNISVVVYCSVV